MGIGSYCKHPPKIANVYSNMTTVLFINLKPRSNDTVKHIFTRFRMFLYGIKVLHKFKPLLNFCVSNTIWSGISFWTVGTYDNLSFIASYF